MSTATNIFNGTIWVHGTETDVHDGAILVYTDTTEFYDGTIWVYSIASNRFKGTLRVTETDFPYLANPVPVRNAVGVELKPTISFDIKDDGSIISGVNIASVIIAVKINGDLYQSFEYTGSLGTEKHPLIHVTGDPNCYSFSLQFFIPGIQPAVNFDYGSLITVEVYAEDFEGNSFVDSFSFMTQFLDALFDRKEEVLWSTTQDFLAGLEYGIGQPTHNNTRAVDNTLELIQES